MPIVEVNNIETAIGDSNTWLDVGLTLIGVAVGFGLSEFATLIRRTRLEKRTGELFTLDIRALKDQLDWQTVHFEELVGATRRREVVHATLTVTRTVQSIAEIDRLLVQQYFSARKPVVTPDLIRRVYNGVSIIGIEVERFQSVLTIYNQRMSETYASYNVAINLVSRTLADYHAKNLSHAQGDPLVMDSMKLFKEQFFDQSYDEILINMRGRFHEPFMQILFKDPHHPLYNDLTKFNQDALDCINNLERDSDWMGNQITTINSSLTAAAAILNQI